MAASSPSVPTARDRLTIDLRGMKTALQAQARAKGVPVSVLVRELLTNCAGTVEAGAGESDPYTARRVRVSMRLREDQARDLLHRARQAGRPLGAYVVGLMRTGVEPQSAEERTRAVAALTRSNADCPMAIIAERDAYQGSAPGTSARGLGWGIALFERAHVKNVTA